MNDYCSKPINVVFHDTEYTSEPFSADPEPGGFHAVHDTAISPSSEETAMELALVRPIKILLRCREHFMSWVFEP